MLIKYSEPYLHVTYTDMYEKKIMPSKLDHLTHVYFLYRRYKVHLIAIRIPSVIEKKSENESNCLLYNYISIVLNM